MADAQTGESPGAARFSLVPTKEDSVFVADLEAGKDVIRAELHEYEGRVVASIRRWYRTADGSLKRSGRGLTVGVWCLPWLEDAVRALRAAADAPPVMVES